MMTSNLSESKWHFDLIFLHLDNTLNGGRGNARPLCQGMANWRQGVAKERARGCQMRATPIRLKLVSKIIILFPKTLNTHFFLCSWNIELELLLTQSSRITMGSSHYSPVSKKSSATFVFSVIENPSEHVYLGPDLVIRLYGLLCFRRPSGPALYMEEEEEEQGK